ncbi:hypothetical protein L9F63_019835, partial [Diploptera punctata]
TILWRSLGFLIVEVLFVALCYPLAFIFMYFRDWMNLIGGTSSSLSFEFVLGLVIVVFWMSDCILLFSFVNMLLCKCGNLFILTFDLSLQTVILTLLHLQIYEYYLFLESSVDLSLLLNMSRGSILKDCQFVV